MKRSYLQNEDINPQFPLSKKIENNFASLSIIEIKEFLILFGFEYKYRIFFDFLLNDIVDKSRTGIRFAVGMKTLSKFDTFYYFKVYASEEEILLSFDKYQDLKIFA